MLKGGFYRFRHKGIFLVAHFKMIFVIFER